MLEILFLLLPLAFYSGWRTAYKRNKDTQAETREVSTRFVRGINFLLNEDPDKALDIFLEAPAIDAQTAETFLTLGKMFRNRGEVNRALRLHQHLVARPDLSNTQRQAAMLALGEDFFAAGLLDRAESVFRELITTYPKNTQACVPLRHIYEQLQEWDKAIELAACSVEGKVERNRLVAHYWCEQATEYLQKNQLFQVDEALKKASASDPELARIQVLKAELALARDDRPAALKHFRQAIQHDQRLLGSLVQRLLEVFRQPVELQQIQAFVNAEYTRNRDPRLFPPLLAIAHQNGEGQSLLPLVHTHLQQEAVTLQTVARSAAVLADSMPLAMRPPLDELGQALNRLVKLQPRFQCTRCGYKMHDYLWRCPACHQWDTIQHT